MAEKWTPDPAFAKLIAYANDGIGRTVLAACLFKIALDGSNQMASIKAIEVLLTMGTDGGGVPIEEYDPQQVLKLAAAVDKFLNGDDDLYAILNDVSYRIDETETSDNQGDVSRLVPGLRES